jgi:mannose-6-phosphate isomerase-like protein (cupin superfamily)
MISPLKIVSEDERRTLAEVGAGGTWKVMKYVKTKGYHTIGNHLHKEKDECFLLVTGSGEVVVGTLRVKVKAPIVIDVPRNTYHAFKFRKDSILICLASEEHTPDDDHKLQ